MKMSILTKRSQGLSRKAARHYDIEIKDSKHSHGRQCRQKQAQPLPGGVNQPMGDYTPVGRHKITGEGK